MIRDCARSADGQSEHFKEIKEVANLWRGNPEFLYFKVEIAFDRPMFQILTYPWSTSRGSGVTIVHLVIHSKKMIVVRVSRWNISERKVSIKVALRRRMKDFSAWITMVSKRPHCSLLILRREKLLEKLDDYRTLLRLLLPVSTAIVDQYWPVIILPTTNKSLT